MRSQYLSLPQQTCLYILKVLSPSQGLGLASQKRSWPRSMSPPPEGVGIR